jgi:protein-L-isoaspartate(D-aspartate) O-methyltransferase
MEDEAIYESERWRMVETQLVSRQINDPRVLDAMRTIPRHRFVSPDHRSFAYTDGPLPIGLGQTISQPYIVALMTQLLQLQGPEKVLEVGTGSGYQAAILGYLAKEVHSVERHPELATAAARVLTELGLNNVHIHIGDGSSGWIDHAPYDAIIVTAAAPRVPQVILDQIADPGRLVIPVGARGGQYLETWERHGDDLHSEANIPVAFVPLIGQFGWHDYY